MKTLTTATLFTFSLFMHGAFAQQKEPPPVLAEAPPVLSVPGGRFVFGRLFKTEPNQYLLDTQTGRLWYIVSYSDKDHPNALALQSVLFLSENGTIKFAPDDADKPKSK